MFLLTGFVLYVLPNVKTRTFFGVSLLFMLIALMAWAFGKYFSGEGGRRYLVIAGVAVLLGILLFIATGGL